ncbi:MAG: ATP-dependent zinc protease [Silanimonas lenta]
MSAPTMPGAAPIRVLGWREWLALPALGLPAIRAKIDTGARSSCLHVEAIETRYRAGREQVRFLLAPGEGCPPHWAEAPVLDRRIVTDSGGHRSERIFILTPLRLAGEDWPIEINLTHRRNMLFPMLLGRTAMAGRFLVDPARSFVLGDPGADQAHLALA